VQPVRGLHAVITFLCVSLIFLSNINQYFVHGTSRPLQKTSSMFFARRNTLSDVDVAQCVVCYV
jgi:hypothetical protein